MAEIEKDGKSDDNSSASEVSAVETEIEAVSASTESGSDSVTEPSSVETAIAAAKLQWEAAELDFTESESVASDESLSKIEELARRVAETVAHNEALASEPLNERSEQSMLDSSGLDDMQQMGFSALEQELEAAENDADADPQEFVEHDQLISIVESLLFSTDKPVSVATIKALFKGTNVRTKDITRALDILASDYASATRGVTLEEINGGYQLRTKSDNTAFLRRLAKVRPFRLSGPALEVMSIIAYKQPVTKHEIDEIRGVESGHLVRALMERGMVCFNGKAENLPGKPMAYGTTRKFLETFGLRNIRELPTLSEIDELLPEGIGDEVEEKESLSDLTAKLSNEITGSYSEGEEELQKIAASLQSVDTTTEFFEQEKERERERRDRERAQDIRERLMLEADKVETKDRRWLERFEAKAAALEAGIVAAGIAQAAMDAEAQPISDQLTVLTDESNALEDERTAEEAALLAADQAEADELSAVLDYDDDEADEIDHEPHEGDV